VIDDIADSFDYKNKYAIIQYLKDIANVDNFYQIILTHNFDFLRTIVSRGVVGREQCFYANKSKIRIELTLADYVMNPFVNVWKSGLSSSIPMLVASIPFARNIAEYALGDKSDEYLALTSLLHLKDGSEDITIGMLNESLEKIFPKQGVHSTLPANDKVIEIIEEAATKYGDRSLKLEDKIVLSIAIRLSAERFSINNISDKKILGDIVKKNNPTSKLIEAYKAQGGSDKDKISVLDDVLLMTPENIHLNAFMYEPIIDLGDDELKGLYNKSQEVLV